jgi:SP family galactose:H+ symporter-like MFS transporter
VWRGNAGRVALLAGLGGILFGYDTGVIGGAQLFIEKDFHLSNFGDELLVATVLAGAIVGSLIASRLLEARGRRFGIITAGFVFMIGTAGATAAPGATFLDASRIIVGVGIGLVSVAAPLYIAEMSTAERRGSMVSVYQLAITVGIFAAYIVDEAFSEGEQWRIMFAIGLIPALLLVLGARKLPESARWLVSKGRTDEAHDVIGNFLDAPDPNGTITDIRDAIDAETGRGWRELLTPALRPALTVGVGLALVQQLTGINTVIYYAPQIFEDAGLKSSSAAILASVSVSVVNILSTLIAIRFVDRLGRRPLLTIGLIGMTASLSVLAIGFATFSGTMLSVTAIASLMVYVCFFAFSLGPIVWVMISEIFPLRARSDGASVATTANWASNLLVSLTFLSLIDALGTSGVFWLFAGVGVLSLWFVRARVPETRGRTLEEIEEDLGASPDTASDANVAPEVAPA